MAVDRLVTQRMPEGSPRTSLWNRQTVIPQHESDAKRRSTIDEPEVWRIINPAKLGPYGDPVGYAIAGGHQAVTLLSDDDFVRRRAGFTESTLWVTPFESSELFAAGDYPTAHGPDQGLPGWRTLRGTGRSPARTSWPGTPSAFITSRGQRIGR